jgi:hypothetical protein
MPFGVSSGRWQFGHALVALIVAASMGLSACVQPRARPTCFDGWTTDYSGPSQLIEPTEGEWQRIRPHMPEGADYWCTHRNPGGAVSVIFEVEGDTSVAIFQSDGTALQFVEYEFIVGHRTR